ncbi:C1 family peptidase, partial [Salmonella sp. s51228]|uniref:C1 family peptidase n=1 Tax=Salmonella sp. s51228 TaxID=3159652 RepID=UPI00398085D2
AFSATGSLEGQYFHTHGTLLSFSEQQLVDCSHSYGNNGCNGGLMDNAFRFWRVNRADLESAYPYTGVQGTCRHITGITTVPSYVNVPHGNVMALKTAVHNIGPISVAMDASRGSFHVYTHGVYGDPLCSSSRLDHGVLVVGYGT